MGDVTFRQSFNSFSGVDMHVVMGTEVIGELQGLSYTVTREKGPNYTFGSADPRSFSRGKRGIAGSMVFLQFDRSPMIDVLGIQPRSAYVANDYEAGDRKIRDIGSTSQGFIGGNLQGTFGVNNGTNRVTASKVLARPQYADQVMPFVVSILAANEYGHTATMHIRGIEIMNMGTALSIDDMTTDESCTWVATEVVPWGEQHFVRDAIVRESSPKAPLSGGGSL